MPRIITILIFYYNNIVLHAQIFSLERRVSLLLRENSFYLLLLWTRSERVARERTLGYIGILTLISLIIGMIDSDCPRAEKSWDKNDNIVKRRKSRYEFCSIRY